MSTQKSASSSKTTRAAKTTKTTKTAKANTPDLKLSASERDTLGEVENMCMGACATTLSTLLGKRVTITTPKVSVCDKETLFSEYGKPIVVAEVAYTEGVEGSNIFILKKEDALLITDLLMGNDGTSSEEELKEYYLSATSEVMNQMVGSSATALADIVGSSINIAPPKVTELTKESGFSEVEFDDEVFIKVSFRMEIEGLIVSNIMNLMTYDFGKNLVHLLTGDSEDAGAVEQSSAAAAAEVSISKGAGESMQSSDNRIDLKTVQYQSFNNSGPQGGALGVGANQKNINLLMDVPLQVTVVLGKCRKSIEELLKLNTGSIVVLDRLAGEMVDVQVNGKLFARGEVVVIDDNYGVRITELIESENDSGLGVRKGKKVLMGN